MTKQNQKNNNKLEFDFQLKDKVRHQDNGLPEKQFITRNSLLTDLLENEHIKVVYHLFVATFIGLFVEILANDILIKGDIKVGLRLIIAAFSNVHYALLIWVGYYTFTCFSYVAFLAWAKIRMYLSPKSGTLQLWDRLWFLSLVGYYVLSFAAAQHLVKKMDLQPASCAIVVIEQARMLMKVHAFVRYNAENVLKYKPHSDMKLKLPTFTHFVYFTFAPTLVYREEYPRTKATNWRHVFLCLGEGIGILFYYSFVIERFLHPAFKDFGIRKYTKTELILLTIENAVSGILLLLATFYLVLHCCQNLFAELLRFGDRMFYKDWWRSTSYSEYYRKWNVIVHDWLYTYVYKDMVQIVAPNRRVLAKAVVFLVSAAVHEWILTFMFGFCLPALFIQFFIMGTILNFVRGPNVAIVNVLFWYSLAIGTGSLISVYAIEFYARVNVPLENERMIDFFIPRFLTCDCIV